MNKRDCGIRPPQPAHPLDVHRSPGLAATVTSLPVDVGLEIAGLTAWVATLTGLVNLAMGFASPPGAGPSWRIEEHRVQGVQRWHVSKLGVDASRPRARKSTWHDDLAGALREVGLESEARAVDRPAKKGA